MTRTIDTSTPPRRLRSGGAAERRNLKSAMATPPIAITEECGWFMNPGALRGDKIGSPWKHPAQESGLDLEFRSARMYIADWAKTQNGNPGRVVPVPVHAGASVTFSAPPATYSIGVGRWGHDGLGGWGCNVRGYDGGRRCFDESLSNSPSVASDLAGRKCSIWGRRDVRSNGLTPVSPEPLQLGRFHRVAILAASGVNPDAFARATC